MTGGRGGRGEGVREGGEGDMICESLARNGIIDDKGWGKAINV